LRLIMLEIKRQENRKSRSMVPWSRPAHETDVAMMLLDDVLGNPESKSGSNI
jgi:hypothetical protein